MRILKSIIMMLALIATTTLSAQTITSVHGTVSDDMGPLMGATVCEMDANGRIINSAITDLNGNLRIRRTRSASATSVCRPLPYPSTRPPTT